MSLTWKTKEKMIMMGFVFVNSMVLYPNFKRKYQELFKTKAKVTHTAFFDIEIEGEDEGRIVIDLYGEEAPKTVNNFLGLCMAAHDQRHSYWNSKFHKIVPDYIIQGGDIINENGEGSCSVYDEDTFDMEINKLKFKEPYLLAAAKRADGKIGSQFFITNDTLPFLNGKYCIFGKVSDNNELCDLISACGSPEGIPEKDVRIKRSGIYKAAPKKNKSAAELTDFKADISKRN
ncbi:unnamed protein product [Moneuplotes crassus]|uniref:Peptidyl-prolyl cis-trans isomerase n=1 Tax=Euplotes crassus TaxID=5936 RepID=A0AAD1XW86_EUPCR|nr:unnamed protein product [Moneuplotes crassus]